MTETTSNRTMRAVVVDRPGTPEVLQVRDVPVPQPEPGQVLILVKAFGLNRSELHFRQGVRRAGRSRGARNRGGRHRRGGTRWRVQGR